MIEWFTVLQMILFGVTAAVCLGAALLKKAPGDVTMGLTLLCALALVAQTIMALFAPAFGNSAAGDLLEFWMYLLVALALPIGAGLWALIDRSHWAHLILAWIAAALVVISYRMAVIWGLWG